MHGGGAARKVDQQCAARKVIQSEGGSFYALRFLPLLDQGNRLVGMWESRVLCEISKHLWESFCDFHRSVISTAARLFVVTSLVAVKLGIVDLGRRADRRSWGILRGRL